MVEEPITSKAKHRSSTKPCIAAHRSSRSDARRYVGVANGPAARRQTDRAQHQRELAKVDADIAKTEQAIDRCLLAFEAGTLPEAQCGPRVRGLGAKLVDLQERRTELADLLDSPQPAAPTAEQLAQARQHIHDAIDNGDDKHRKHLLQTAVRGRPTGGMAAGCRCGGQPA